MSLIVTVFFQSDLIRHCFVVKEEVKLLLKEIKHHLDDGRRGERLRSGVHVTIVGAPNAGKSSLLNILCKQAPRATHTTLRNVHKQYQLMTVCSLYMYLMDI